MPSKENTASNRNDGTKLSHRQSTQTLSHTHTWKCITKAANVEIRNVQRENRVGKYNVLTVKIHTLFDSVEL